MPELKKIKKLIIEELHKIINGKIESAKSAIASAKESRDEDTKSSAGDKYETGRAMMQIELDKNESQLEKAVFLKNGLFKIDLEKQYDKVEYGCLVVTNQGNYFISIGIGKLNVKDRTYYSISLVSPIGKVLLGKKVGDNFIFQNREYEILEII